MKIVSLMAGVSSRLKPLTDNCHKVMLDVGGKELVKHQLDAFKIAGLTEAVFVVGHKADAICAALGNNYNGVRIRYIYNPEYSTRNINYSLYLAKEEVAGQDFIYMEADLLFHPKILDMVANASCENCVVVDGNSNNAKVDTLVLGDGRNVTGLLFKEHGDLRDAIGKNKDIVGELIMVIKFGANSSEALFDNVGKNSFTGTTTLYSIFEKCFKNSDTRYLLSGRYPWIEIDNYEDLKRARDVVYQKIKKEAI